MIQLYCIILNLLLTTTPQGSKAAPPPVPVPEPPRLPSSAVESRLLFHTGGYGLRIAVDHHFAPTPFFLGASYGLTTIDYPNDPIGDDRGHFFFNHMQIRGGWQGRLLRAGVSLHAHTTHGIPEPWCFIPDPENTAPSPALTSCPESFKEDPRQFYFVSAFVRFGSESGSLLSLEVTTALSLAMRVQYDWGKYLPYFRLERLLDHPIASQQNKKDGFFEAELGVKIRLGKRGRSPWLLQLGASFMGAVVHGHCADAVEIPDEKTETIDIGISVGVQYVY